MTERISGLAARIFTASLATIALVASLALAGAPTSASAASAAVAAPQGAVSAIDLRPAADMSLFRPGNIISDEVFFDSTTMTEGQIDSFLKGKVSKCQSGYTCLRDFRQNTATRTADTYCDTYTGASAESAARILSKVATACGLNPQVLIVMLEKEQSLITHTWPSDWRYTIAMGQGCPDTAACDTRYYGFFNQVYGAARQLKIYSQNKYFTYYAPGKTWNIRYNPNASCGSSPVYIQNQATANLYYYTPYQPNAAALRAGAGEGDSCSAYGNRNFFRFFTDWFGSTTTQRGAAITRFWQDSGGASGWIGGSTGAMTEWPGRGWSQRFENADLYLKNGTTAVQATVGGTRTEYRAVGEANSGLGWPAGVVSRAFGGWYQDFDSGRIYVRPSDGRGFAVAPPISDTYEKAGNVTGTLGWPSTRAYSFSGGARQDFAGGSIFQGPTATTALSAAWTTVYTKAGGVASVGWPTAVAKVDAGQYVQFTAGLMLRTSADDRFTVRGEIYRGYAAAGGISGALGAPINNEKATTGGFMQRFEGGSVFATTSGTFAVTALSKALTAAGTSSTVGPPTGPQVGSNGSYSQDFGATTLTTSKSGNYAVAGVIGRQYRSLGAANSYLGAAVGPEKKVAGGVMQQFQGGRIYCSTSTTVDVPASIATPLDVAGGVQGRLGMPTGAFQTTERGKSQSFQGGEVWVNADRSASGAVVGAILNTARAAGGFAALGAPTSAEREEASGWIQPFESGVVTVARTGFATAVTGAVWKNYRDNGKVDAYGFATGPLATVATGWKAQPFEKVTVYVGSSATYVTRGYIRTVHLQQGGAGGVLGIPVKNEYATAGGFRQDFTGGSILVSAKGGFVTRGAIRTEWLRRGGEKGSLGWPIENERSGDGRWSQRFEKGTLVLSADGSFRVQ